MELEAILFQPLFLYVRKLRPLWMEITSSLPQKWLQIGPGLELQTHISQPSAFSIADPSNINHNLAKRISNLSFEFYLGRQKDKNSEL